MTKEMMCPNCNRRYVKGDTVALIKKKNCCVECNTPLKEVVDAFFM